MEKEQYQDFLCRIAKQVDSLLVEDTSVIGRFRGHLQSFEDKENKHLGWLNKQRELCFKKGKTFSISSDMEVPPEYECPISMLILNPTTKHLPEPKNKEEEYQRYYIILSSIHDNTLPEVERIDNGILPEQTAYPIWTLFGEFYDSEYKRVFIEQAFKRVQAEKPAETERDAALAKREKESWLWKLYEVTLKVIVDAVLEWWSKPK
jgi:hypothetical protein